MPETDIKQKKIVLTFFFCPSQGEALRVKKKPQKFNFQSYFDGFRINIGTPNRDGHAEADDAEVCGLMRICGSVAEDKICMRHSRQKNRSKIEQNWGADARARPKTVKILNKNSQKSIKNRPKMGPKW